jgi:E3 ubiquitin-protein ligase RNF14
MSLEDGDPEKLVLERRFGKAQLSRLVEKLKEDLENKKWLEQSTTQCPNCLVSVEKSVGCNHVRLLHELLVTLAHLIIDDLWAL